MNETCKRLFAPAVLLAVILIGLETKSAAVAPRTNAELCEEVREVLIENIEVGLTTKEEAKAIVTRCYNTFVWSN